MHLFFAYPACPQQIGITIDAAASELKVKGTFATTWQSLDIAGKFIADGVTDAIDASDALIADITKLNFNVMFEIGYAMGCGKRVFTVLNRGMQPQLREITLLGICDTLAYGEYQNSRELTDQLERFLHAPPSVMPSYAVDFTSPLYVVESSVKTDAQLRILSKIKKAKLSFRSFDPNEQSRLSMSEAIKHVGTSISVVLNLLGAHATDSVLSNLRAAFVLGVAKGMQKDVLVFQDGEEPVPLDYRDLVQVYKHPSDVDAHIASLAPRVMEALQERQRTPRLADQNAMATLDFGSPAAENEMKTLGEYYVQTDEFLRTRNGQARLVIGRKGAGKTALFLQLRDYIRRNRTKIVLDLKPEGYQLLRFKKAVLDAVSEAARVHLTTAFWEYALLLEICRRLIEKDRINSHRSHETRQQYEALRDYYARAGRASDEGDFSERMQLLIEGICDRFDARTQDVGRRDLSAGDVTHIVYTNEINDLRSLLIASISERDELWVLFDNIDKGWPTHGVEPSDVVIVRGLLEGTRKIEQFFSRHEKLVRTVVFLRNDVYELLVNESPDRGKESRVSLDWTDPDRLRELLRRRIVNNPGFDASTTFAEVWSRICISHVDGEESSEFLIDRSLMRPRNLVTMLNYAKSNAVNLNHARITEEDIRKAVSSFSADAVNDIGYEIRDVFPQADNMLYQFMGSSDWLKREELCSRFLRTGIAEEKHPMILNMLLWFSFLGIVRDRNGDIQETYIYQVNYDMRKLRVLGDGIDADSTMFCIHKTFWPFLEINKTVR